VRVAPAPLLQLMLNAHPQVAIAGEVGFFNEILQLRDRVRDLSTAERIDRLFALLQNLDRYKYLPKADVIFPVAQARLNQTPGRAMKSSTAISSKTTLTCVALAASARRRLAIFVTGRIGAGFSRLQG
jgi:hypothetical protein